MSKGYQGWVISFCFAWAHVWTYGRLLFANFECGLLGPQFIIIIFFLMGFGRGNLQKKKMIFFNINYLNWYSFEIIWQTSLFPKSCFEDNFYKWNHVFENKILDECFKCAAQWFPLNSHKEKESAEKERERDNRPFNALCIAFIKFFFSLEFLGNAFWFIGLLTRGGAIYDNIMNLSTHCIN